MTGGRSRSWEPGDYVTDIRFADARNGWAFNRDLWATHDGGDTWTALHLGSPVLSLETTAGKTYALVASCRLKWSDCRGPVRLYEATVGSDDWRAVLDVDGGSPSAPNGSVVVSGRSVFAMVHPSGSPHPGKTPSLHALTPAGRWVRRPVPSSCSWSASLIAASPRDLFLFCQTGDGAGGSAPHEFYVSRDGGVRWTRTFKDRSTYPGPIAITPEGRFLADSTESLHIERPDGSRETTHFDASGQYNESIIALQFVTPRHGVVLTGKGVYITDDAGRHWDPIPLPL
jgi:photosystem II stability/assembly factor-like uncharacterized protein